MAFVDYYQLLQVHRAADREIIEAAYKRLAKKYHPDVAPNAEAASQMTRVNEAYEILKNEVSRKRYDEQWDRHEAQIRSQWLQNHQGSDRPNHQRHGNASDTFSRTAYSNEVHLAKMTLTRYMEAIQRQHYSEAYRHIAETDQRKMTLIQFERWQTLVAQIFQIENFAVQLGWSEQESFRKMKNGSQLRFVVVTTEYNALMERVEQDLIEKKLILNGRTWQIEMGFGDPVQLIERFEQLNQLLAAKSVVLDMVNVYSKRDGETDLLNKKGFLEEMEKEAARFRRYGRPFSVAMLGIRDSKGKNVHGKERTIAMGRLLRARVRGLDTVGRWSEDTFVIMMPETDLTGAIAAVKKLKRSLRRDLSSYANGTVLVIPAGIEVFTHDLATTMDHLDFFYEHSMRHKTDALQSMRGAELME